MGVLEGKVAIITGGAGGIGREIARAYVREGAKVGLLDINAELLAEAERELPGAQALPCDVSDREQVRHVIDAYANQSDGLDILVNNAAYFYYAPLVDMPEDKVSKMIDVGLKGALWSLQAATPHLITRGGGSIINLSSVAVSVSITNAAVYQYPARLHNDVHRQRRVLSAPCAGERGTQLGLTGRSVPRGESPPECGVAQVTKARARQLTS